VGFALLERGFRALRKMAFDLEAEDQVTLTVSFLFIPRINLFFQQE